MQIKYFELRTMSTVPAIASIRSWKLKIETLFTIFIIYLDGGKFKLAVVCIDKSRKLGGMNVILKKNGKTNLRHRHRLNFGKERKRELI